MERVTRVVQIPIYWLVVGVAVTVVSPLLSLVASVKISSNNQAVIREEQRLATCGLYGGLLDTYRETPPTTPAGLNVEKTYRDFYNSPQLHCQPPR